MYDLWIYVCIHMYVSIIIISELIHSKWTYVQGVLPISGIRYSFLFPLPPIFPGADTNIVWNDQHVCLICIHACQWILHSRLVDCLRLVDGYRKNNISKSFHCCRSTIMLILKAGAIYCLKMNIYNLILSFRVDFIRFHYPQDIVSRSSKQVLIRPHSYYTR